MALYVTLNKNRVAATKGPLAGKVTLWMTSEGKVAVTLSPLADHSIRIPFFLGRFLCWTGIGRRP